LIQRLYFNPSSRFAFLSILKINPKVGLALI
jgi:hypothetical protein